MYCPAMNCQILGLDVEGNQSNNSCVPPASFNVADFNVLLHFPNSCVQIMFISTSVYKISSLDFFV